MTVYSIPFLRPISPEAADKTNPLHNDETDETDNETTGNEPQTDECSEITSQSRARGAVFRLKPHHLSLLFVAHERVVRRGAPRIFSRGEAIKFSYIVASMGAKYQPYVSSLSCCKLPQSSHIAKS